MRSFGNDMAHGDFVSEPGAQETDLVLSLMRGVLDEVYHATAEAARAKAKREARKRVEAAAVDGKQLFLGLEPEQQLAFLALYEKLSKGQCQRGRMRRLGHCRWTLLPAPLSFPEQRVLQQVLLDFHLICHLVHPREVDGFERVRDD